MALTDKQKRKLNELDSFIPGLKAAQIKLGDQLEDALAVASGDIANDAVTTAKIAALAVTEAKLAAAVTAQLIKGRKRVFDFADTDIDVASQSAVINLGAALPAGAVLVGVDAVVTDAFTDGATGTFDLDLGIDGDDNLFLTNGDLDTADKISVTGMPFAVGGEQLVVTVKGDVNLSTLTAGTVEVTFFYFVPDVTVIAAP
jgi:hypothetical protein